jgi:dTDP-glucose 4,6-dehydratase
MLVTGGAGFIGTNFVRHWSAGHPDDEVVVLDALTYAGRRQNLTGLPAITLVQGDIQDGQLVQQLLRERRLDTIVHFAAETHVDRSIGQPDAFVRTNVVGTHALLHAARAEWLDAGSGRPHRFHHVSTDEVYGSLEPRQAAFTERTAFAPNSPYSASKASSDHFVRAYHRTYGLQATVTRCSNNYGPFQHREKLIPLCLTSCLLGKALPIYGDGLNVRDWLHVEDHCRAIELVLTGGRPGETYNVGGGEERTNLDLVESLCKLVDRLFEADPRLARQYPGAPPALGRATESLIVSVADRPGHDRRYALNDDKARRQLGYRPQRKLEEGLEETIHWYLDNPDWWRSGPER